VILNPASLPPTAPTAAPPALIQLREVEKTYAGRSGSAAVTALHTITLDVPKGAILGVIGRSGAGKSTLIRLVNGLEQPTRGQVIVDGIEMSALEERAASAAPSA
jgi:D-methionine transport system ATP-binding protein